jgi:hypothetical protein
LGAAAYLHKSEFRGDALRELWSRRCYPPAAR